MKLGIAYNAFDALELLDASIDTVRPVADFVCVVYQDVSNFGESLSHRDRSFLDALRQSGKVDLFYPYRPTNQGGHMNELAKRNIGKNLCANIGCTHHMTMDVDELYQTNQLLTITRLIDSGGWDASACKMQTYWKSPSFVLDPPEEYYVPLIYKIDGRQFDLRNRWNNIHTDPTRRLPSANVKLFERDEIEMHHMSYVRLDIGTKLRNSSASLNFKKKIDRIVSYFNQWKPGQQAYLAGMEERYYDVKEIEPIFTINNIS